MSETPKRPFADASTAIVADLLATLATEIVERITVRLRDSDAGRVSAPSKDLRTAIDQMVSMLQLVHDVFNMGEFDINAFTVDDPKQPGVLVPMRRRPNRDGDN